MYLGAAGIALGLTVGLAIPGSLHFSALAAEAQADHHLIPTSKHLWIIYATDIPGQREKIDPKIWQAHLDSDMNEEKNGHRIMGGAVSDAQGKREYGMFIVRAKNADEAMQIAKSDPAVKAGERTVTVHQFEVHQGVMNFHIHFSDGSTTFD
jgi:uncharacterized protein YciI